MLFVQSSFFFTLYLAVVVSTVLSFPQQQARYRPMHQRGFSPAADCNGCTAGAPSSSFPNVKRIMRDTLVVTQGTLFSDGNPRVDSVLINGTSPGPLLRYRAGDLVLVKVINEMAAENVTIHFHGLSQTLSPSSDGTPMVSQWPIAPGNFYEYEMHLTYEDVGTTFYHSHVGLQVMTATAPLVVEDDPSEAPESIASLPNNEVVMTLTDYFYKTDETIYGGLRGSPFVWPGSANSILLNGKGWPTPGSCNETIADSAGVDCAASTYTGPEIVDVDYGCNYRLRWVGAQALMHLAVGIFNHSQTLIAADGTFIEEVDTEFFEIMSGQRYDTILATKTQEQVDADGLNGCYLIRMETRWRKPQTNGWAMLRYPGGKCNASTTAAYPFNNTANYLPDGEFGWISDQLHPHETRDTHPPAPTDDEVTRRIFLDAQQVYVHPTEGNQSLVDWYVNQLNYNETERLLKSGRRLDMPYLIGVYMNKTIAPSYKRAMHPPNGIQQGFDTLTETYVARAGEVIDVVIINNSSMVNNMTETHPWHFHSQDHWTVAMGLGNFTEEGFQEAKAKFSPPVARDTTGLWPGLGASVATPPVKLPANSSGAWSVLRFKIPDDARASGVWLLHCHWAFHHVMGMATVWSFVPSDEVTAYSTHQYCDRSYLEYGYNVTAPYTLWQMQQAGQCASEPNQ